MTALIAWTSFIGYLTVTMLFARNRIQHWHKDQDALLDSSNPGDRMVAAIAAVSLGLIWPLAVLFFGLRDWLWKPADRDRERLERLRSDERDWRMKAYDRAASEDDRRMAADIANTLSDIVRRSDR